MRVLTWNLFHGRSVPPAGRSLLREFAECLAAWDWDVALLQEVPPWWPAALARAAGAEAYAVLTSRNALAPLRRAAAERLPDLLGANGGGANAILARAPREPPGDPGARPAGFPPPGAGVRPERCATPEIVHHHATRLRLYPERRVAQFVRLAGGVAVVNLHASRSPARAAQELGRVCELATAWSPGGPLVIGGDFNLRRPLPPVGRLCHLAGQGVDHVLARGLEAVGPALQPPRPLAGSGALLSDHPALIAQLG